PTPSGTLAAVASGQDVSLDLNSVGVTLSPGGEYGYSLTAKNNDGEVDGQWHTFEAPYPSTPPLIKSESVSNLGPTSATLEARIAPNGASGGVFSQFQLLLDPGEAPAELTCSASPPQGFSTCVGPQNSEAL